MRKCKQYLFIGLALLPFVFIIFNMIQMIGNDQQRGMIPVGDVTFTETGDQILVDLTDNSFSDYLLSPWLSAPASSLTEDPSFYDSTVQFLHFLSTYSFPINFYTVFAFFCLLYYSMLTVMNLVIEFIFWIPKKLTVILEGHL